MSRSNHIRTGGWQQRQRRVFAGAALFRARYVERYYARHRQRYGELSPRAARRAIRLQLAATREQRAITRFIETFRARYRSMTTCAQGYVVDACSNAP